MTPRGNRTRKRHRRTIIVDGITYTWKYENLVEIRRGRTAWKCENLVEIRRGRTVVLRRPVTEVLGITWDDLERAARKGYGYPLTPARIAELIRESSHTREDRRTDQGASAQGREK